MSNQGNGFNPVEVLHDTGHERLSGGAGEVINKRRGIIGANLEYMRIVLSPIISQAQASAEEVARHDTHQGEVSKEADRITREAASHSVADEAESITKEAALIEERKQAELEAGARQQINSVNQSQPIIEGQINYSQQQGVDNFYGQHIEETTQRIADRYHPTNFGGV